MPKFNRLRLIIVEVMVLVIFGAGIILAISALNNATPKNVSFSQPLPASTVALATVPTQAQCQDQRSFECFLLGSGDTQTIMRNHLGSTFDTVQKAGDYSVKLRLGYADTQKIIVVIEIDSPKTFHFAALHTSFTDETGHQFVSQGEGNGFYTDGVSVGTYTFATGDLKPQQKEINVKLEIPAIAPMAISMPCCPPTPTPGPSPVPPPDKVEGPFVFSFTLPVNSTKTIEPKQTVKTTAYGDVTLEKVVVTPLEIVAYFKGIPTNTVLDASVNGWSSAAEPGGGWRGTMKQDDGTVQITLATTPPLNKRTGQWTMALRLSTDPFMGPVTPPDRPDATATAAPPQPTVTPVPPTPMGAELTPYPSPTPQPVFATFHFNLP